MFEKKKSQRALLSAILPGESVMGQCDGFDLSLGHPIVAQIVVSNRRLLWHWLKPPPAAGQLTGFHEVHTVGFERIHRLAVDRDRAPSPLQAVVLLTQQDPPHGRLLVGAGEGGNPVGETDAALGLPFGSEADDVIRTIIDKCRELSPAWKAFIHGIKRLQSAQRTGVNDWTGCPVCTQSNLERSAHAAYCSSCGLCFTDPGFHPEVRETPAGVGFSGDAPGPLTIADPTDPGRPRIWRFRPKDMRVGPPIVPDPLEERLRDSDPTRIDDDGLLMIPLAHFAEQQEAS